MGNRNYGPSKPLLVAGGGTGAATLASDGVLYGNGTSAVGVTAAGTTGQVLIATTSSAPSFGGTPLTITCDSGSAAASSSGITFNAVSQAESSVSFSGSGHTVSFKVTDAGDNVLVGSACGNATLSGTANTGLGFATLNALTSGSNNMGIGYASLDAVTSGTNNVGIGNAAANGITTGSYNVAIGSNAGQSYTTSDSSNIAIGYSVAGVSGQSNVLTIGNGTGTGTGNINVAKICGIYGAAIGTSTAVLINSSNQLGTAVSSARFKDNIEDLGEGSKLIYHLRPVKFVFKKHPEYGQQAGLIAEEVQKVAPGLVVLDKECRASAVAYQELITLLLNELQKLRKEFNELNMALVEGKN